MLHGITYGDAVDLFAVEFTSENAYLAADLILLDSLLRKRWTRSRT